MNTDRLPWPAAARLAVALSAALWATIIFLLT